MNVTIGAILSRKSLTHQQEQGDEVSLCNRHADFGYVTHGRNFHSQVLFSFSLTGRQGGWAGMVKFVREHD